MIRLKRLLEAKKDIDVLFAKHAQFQEETNYTDWFMKGGCYVYAIALNKILNGSKIISIGDDLSDLAHVCVLWNGYYIDYNTISKNVKDIISTIDLQGKHTLNTTTASKLKREHNFSIADYQKIISFFNQLKS